MSRKERGLGRGLDALFTENLSNDSEKEKVMEIDIDLIFPRADQPRKLFDEESLAELASSVKENGVLQPVILRKKDDTYEIIAGERRFRAAKMAGLKTIPSLIMETDDEKAAQIALIENLQRDDLTPIEEARSFKQMIERFGYTQEELAEKLGKSRSYIANTMRLLNLPEKIIELLEKGKLTAGHARALLALENPEEQLKTAEEILKNSLTVREAEKKVQTRKKNSSVSKEPEIADLEEKLQNYLGTKAKISRTRRGGKIEITYYSEDDLQRILEMWGIIE
ncbi:ParB/RepB/Spo0J family partition protein [Thermosyntropha sp.]|uniref:ParB/RepB/Spo0J family partition protein n=1 Tax=Thermosyntropha sp. TaxID=2740820 RepID=UPI0025D67924|nr:ParB/RepB/Spo0J family partition protein [Thermosyntropha sp.]